MEIDEGGAKGEGRGPVPEDVVFLASDGPLPNLFPPILELRVLLPGLHDLWATQALQALFEQNTIQLHFVWSFSPPWSSLSVSLSHHHLFYSFNKGLWRSYPGTTLSIFKIRRKES